MRRRGRRARRRSFDGHGDKNAADGAPSGDAGRAQQCSMDGIVVMAKAKRTKRRCCSTARRSATDRRRDGHRRRPDRWHHAHVARPSGADRGDALSERGTMFDPGPCVYMEKIAAGPIAADVIYRRAGEGATSSRREGVRRAGERCDHGDPRSQAPHGSRFANAVRPARASSHPDGDVAGAISVAVAQLRN